MDRMDLVSVSETPETVAALAFTAPHERTYRIKLVLIQSILLILSKTTPHLFSVPSASLR